MNSMNYFRPKEPSPEEIIDKEKFEELKRHIWLSKKPIDRALLIRDKIPFTQKYGVVGKHVTSKKVGVRD